MLENLTERLARVVKTIKGIKTERLPEFMAAGPVELFDGLGLEIGQSTLEVLDLGNRHLG